MPISEPTPSLCIASPSQPGRYRWFVKLCAAAIAMAVLPTALLQGPTLVFEGFSSSYGGVLASIYLPLSFAIWQGSLLLLCSSGREIVARNVKETAALNTLYVMALTAAVSLFFLFPARS